MIKNNMRSKFYDYYIGGTSSEKKNFIWNMVGSMIFAGASMILSLLIIRIVGENEGGIFAIAITVAQMLAFIEYYETRTYQVTDTKETYCFGEYKATKTILFIIAIIVSILYSLNKGHMDLYKCMVIILMCIYRFIDAYADLYEGAFQKDGRLDLTGKSQAFRTIFSVGVMLVILVLTKNMIISIVCAIISALIGLVIFDVIPMKLFRKITTVWNMNALLGILKNCFPLFVGSFLWSYILSASRISVDANMTSNFSAYFQTIFMPVSIVNLFATFVMKPALTKLTEQYSFQDVRPFIVYALKIVFLIIVFSVISVLGAYFFGVPILQILTGVSLIKYKFAFIILMCSGGLNALSYFGYYILTIMRKSNSIIGGYVVASIVAKVANDFFVVKYGIIGAAYGFLSSVAVLFTIFYVSIVINLIKKFEKHILMKV